jgi:hypothetical protein
MRRRLGNRHVNTYYDALWRPVLEESLDYADIGGTLSQVVKRYDHEGRIVFQSYPKRGVDRPNESQGIHTIYDALGRTTSSSQDSEQGLLTTLTEYLPGFQTPSLPVLIRRRRRSIGTSLANRSASASAMRTVVCS